MIYFIQAVNGGHIKIGYATDVKKRLETLQVGNPFELRVIGTIEGDMKTKFRIHKRFEQYRYRNEWFEPSVNCFVLSKTFIGSILEACSRRKKRPTPCSNPNSPYGSSFKV